MAPELPLPSPVPRPLPRSKRHPQPPPAQATPSAAALLHTNLALIDQALALVAWHQQAPGRPYTVPAGAHLRHVIEHYQALLWPAAAGLVQYDARARDAELARCPARARQALLAIQGGLRARAGRPLDQAVQVPGLAGLQGELAFCVPSTWGRELAFLASHTVHHLALIKALAPGRAWSEDLAFGLAPATLAHARQGATDRD